MKFSKHLVLLASFLTFVSACSKNEVLEDDTQFKEYIDAEQFFMKNRFEPAKITIDGQENIDVILSAIATEIDGNKDIDILVASLIPEIDVNKDIDNIISGYAAEGEAKSGKLLVSKTQTKQIFSLSAFENLNDENSIAAALFIPQEVKGTDGGVGDPPENWQIPDFSIDLDFELIILNGTNDFIFSGIDTQTEENDLFDLDFALYFTAKYEGRPVKVDPDYLASGGKQVKLLLKKTTSTIKNQNIYMLPVNSEKDFFEEGFLSEHSGKWKQSTKGVSYDEDGEYLIIDLTESGLIAIGTPHWAPQPEPIDISINIEGGNADIETVPWLILESRLKQNNPKSLSGTLQQKLNPLEVKRGSLFSTTQVSAPEGETATILLLGKDKKQNHVLLGKKKIILAKKQTVTFNTEK